MVVKREIILRNILFTFGVILALVSSTVLVLEIIHLVQGPIIEETSYLVLQFATVIFKLILSLYAIYGLRRIDEVINPLFTFTILYMVFVTFQTISFVGNGGLAHLLEPTSLNAILDLVVAIIFFAITLTFKIDDWRSSDKE